MHKYFSEYIRYNQKSRVELLQICQKKNTTSFNNFLNYINKKRQGEGREYIQI